MHEHDQRAVARNVVGNRGPVVPLQGPGARPSRPMHRRVRARWTIAN